jgi:hypothetical protein
MLTGTYSKQTTNTMEMPLEEANSNQDTPQSQSRPVDTASHPLARPSKKRDRSGENFSKRWNTLVKSLCQVHLDHGARVYLSISMPSRQRNLVFRSDEGVSPILPSDLVIIISPCRQD